MMRQEHHEGRAASATPAKTNRRYASASAATAKPWAYPISALLCGAGLASYTDASCLPAGTTCR